jgi:hypothetical protein
MIKLDLKVPLEVDIVDEKVVAPYPNVICQAQIDAFDKALSLLSQEQLQWVHEMEDKKTTVFEVNFTYLIKKGKK